jgi:hypothetical protein
MVHCVVLHQNQNEKSNLVRHLNEICWRTLTYRNNWRLVVSLKSFSTTKTKLQRDRDLKTKSRNYDTLLSFIHPFSIIICCHIRNSTSNNCEYRIAPRYDLAKIHPQNCSSHASIHHILIFYSFNNLICSTDECQYCQPPENYCKYGPI